MTAQGVLLIDKPKGKTSFSLVSLLRRRLGVKTIGHAGTLDPFATGVMVMLIGKPYTRLSNQFLCQDKEYLAELHFGVVTDSYDCDGEIVRRSDIIPTQAQLEEALTHFQGEVEQIPPMFSAKKINGKKLYDLARQGKVVERAPVKVFLETELLNYEYPYASIRVKCSKGTYVRSIAYDLGEMLKCGAHLSNLQRIRSGVFHLKDCVNSEQLNCPDFDLSSRLKASL